MEPGPYKTNVTNNWNSFFSNVSRQGTIFDSPIADNGRYYAFLSKADYDESTDTWSVMFEVQPAKWVINVFEAGSVQINYMAPVGPASIFHLTSVLTNPLLEKLGLSSTDDLAEGTWYAIAIEKQDSGPLNGIFYNPDIDTNPNNPALFYGNYGLNSAELAVELILNVYTPNIPVPRRGVKRKDWPVKVNNALAVRTTLKAKRQRITRAKYIKSGMFAVAPPVTSIGAMDIGQGNCNLLLDTNNEPFTYFDIGYPLWFYVGSLPANLNYANLGGAYLGPIAQNTANDLEVVLSHWDWDHWRMGKIANMITLPWLVPNQPVGGSALNFFNSLTNVQIYGGAPFNAAGNTFTLHRCNPIGLPAAAVLNNSGIAMKVNMLLPTASAVPTEVMMTADANFNKVAGYPFVNLTGIEAVHHGSNAHGASNNLPVPMVNPAGTGRIFYSYGIRKPSVGPLVYVYGFPVAASVTDYHTAGWTVENGTAEGLHIRALPTVQTYRGNVRVGSNAQLPVAYNNTAFYIFPNTIN